MLIYTFKELLIALNSPPGGSAGNAQSGGGAGGGPFTSVGMLLLFPSCFELACALSLRTIGGRRVNGAGDVE